MMPAAEAEHRAEQTTLLSGMIHQRWTDETFVAKVSELAAGPLADPRQTADSETAVTIRRLKRLVDKKDQAAPQPRRGACPHRRPGPKRLGTGPAGKQLRPFPALAGQDLRTQAAAGRGPGLQAIALRRPAGRLRAGGTDGERRPRAGRSSRAARGAGGGHSRQRAAGRTLRS